MRVRYVLLCEDDQTACFMRRFLRGREVEKHEIREKIAPGGRGSGEQWVRMQFPAELNAMRARPGVRLFVGTDADAFSVTERIATLDQACREASVAMWTRTEQVAMIVPRRNIETWFAYLRGTSVDETTNYPRYDHESDCREDVRRLDAMCRANTLRPPVPPSLSAACEELRRIA